MRKRPQCRFCSTSLSLSFADLGMSPLSNTYLDAGQLNKMEPFYPLHAWVCESCYLVQLEMFESPQRIFSDYAYFSSFSDLWLEHVRHYAEKIIERLHVGTSSSVVEIASNDGYLLQYFVARGIPVLGIDPAENVAVEAKGKGVPTLTKFFGTKTACELANAGKHADLLIANNVLAHVPDLNDFVAGMTILLKPSGVVTMEFPHLLRLIKQVQFDTIYHEHFSYFSFSVAEKILSTHGLTIFDVEEIPTHGGSLRVYAKHARNSAFPVGEHVSMLRRHEQEEGLNCPNTYQEFSERVKASKRSLLRFLIDAREAGMRVVGYGAPAKGNTLLNYCGVRTDLLDYTVDRSPHKQGHFLPGTHIPVHAPERIHETRPDYVLILPWNLKDEIVKQMAAVRSWGGKFVVPIPKAKVIE